MMNHPPYPSTVPRILPLLAVALLFPLSSSADLQPSRVDFRYSPPEWQTAICLPDDTHKSLVDRSGELLYHYGQGGREFATRVGIEAVPGALWISQKLVGPRVPIVRTVRKSEDLEILEEAFAVTRLRDAESPAVLRRLDNGTVQSNWASPPEGFDPTLRDIALHYGGPLRFELQVPKSAQRQLALVLCEGYWSETGKRVQVLEVEGAEPITVDAVAEMGRNKPGAYIFAGRDQDGNGRIEIAVKTAAAATDSNTILNALWVFPPHTAIDSKAVLAGKVSQPGALRLDLDAPAGPVRDDVILVHVSNRGAQNRTLTPRIVVDTTRSFLFRPEAGEALVKEHEILSATLRFTRKEAFVSSKQTIELEPLTVPPGKTVRFAVRYSSRRGVTKRFTVREAVLAREQAVKFWEGARLPYGVVSVPDPGVQALVDSAIRNIWQAREIKNGLPAFQVGPTCYRGLWIVDGAFLLEAATLLGAGKEARNGVAYELTYQQPDGRIQVMQNFSKENGIVLWTCVRHAQLTQDKVWLEGLWPRLERIAEHIATLRAQTLTNASPLDDGLVPAGFPDGGIGGMMDEYTNPYWNLSGLRAFIQGARWLGKADRADRWEREYVDFLGAYRRAADRDRKTDPQGNAYVPTRMDGADLPQRGQWAFCQAVYPGQIFAPGDALVMSTLAMLAATEREGMVYGTGWDATGIWNYFASFYGHAWLWQGDGAKAAEALFAFANHAAPILAWREEQSLQGEPFKKVGDMPHNWASAEFIRLTIHLLALDRGEELHLLEGLPAEWLGAGMVTQLKGVATPFGRLHLRVEVDRAGETARLSVKPLAANCRGVVVHLPDGTTQRLDPAKGGRIQFAIR